MSNFEVVGCDRQAVCETKEEAIRAFNYSCKVCCDRGIRLSCDRCAIAVVHEQTLAAIEDVKEAMTLRIPIFVV